MKKFIPYILSSSFILQGCGLYQDAVRQTTSQWIKKRIPEVEKQLEEKIASHETCMEISLLEEKIKNLETNLPLEIQTELELKEGKYDDMHAHSCGPAALELIFSRSREDIPAREISKEIIENGGKYTFMRNLLRLFNSDFAYVTFPQDMQNALKRHGYSSSIKRGSYPEMLALLTNMAKRKQSGLVRLRNKNSRYEHWEPFPPRTTKKWETGNLVQVPVDIPNHFGNDTEIVEVYEINPNLQKRLAFAKKRVEEKIENFYFQIKYLYEFGKSRYLLWLLESKTKNK